MKKFWFDLSEKKKNIIIVITTFSIVVNLMFTAIFLALDNLLFLFFALLFIFSLVCFSLILYLQNEIKKETNNNKTKNITVAYETAPVYTTKFFPIEGFDEKNGRKTRQAILRKIYYKDAGFHFPYQVLYNIEKTETSIDLLANGLKIGEIPKISYDMILGFYNRIKKIDLYIEESQDRFYTPKLKIEVYSEESKNKLNPDYKYVEMNKRVSAPLNEYVVFDTETTGIEVDTNKIIEISALKIKNNQIIDAFYSLLYSTSNNAEYINHISVDELLKAPDSKSVLDSFLEFIGNQPVVGHNVLFDINFIRKTHPFNNSFEDTMMLSHEKFVAKQGAIYVPNIKLDTLCSAFDIISDRNHRAIEDCNRTFRLYETIKNLE